MSLNPEWLEEKSSEDYCEFLKDIRESGDGESKETSPHTSASEDDNNDPLQVLMDVNRKVERKKASKIPVRQSKVSHNADVTKSTYGNSLHYEQLGPAQKAEILFDKTSDVEGQTDLLINKMDSIVVDAFISDANTDVKMSKENLSNLAVPSKLNILKGEGNKVDNQNFTNVSEMERMNVVELKHTNVEHDSRIQKSREVIADIVNNALSLDDPILEAPEEFRSLSGITCFSVSSDMLINKNECGAKTVSEPKPCRTVAAIRDHDNVSEPEANTCGWDLLNKGMLESGIENEEICITNQLRKRPVDEKTKSAEPSEATNMQSSESKHCQHVLSGGELKDNDQTQSNSISITEFDTVQHECVCDNNKSMIGLLNDCAGSCSNLEKLQTTSIESFFVTPKKLLNEPHVESLNNLNLCKESLFSDDVYPEGRDSVNELDSSVSDNGAYACAGNEQTLTAVKPSIAIGVERCAQAPRCSRISVATVCAASTLNSPKSTNFTQNSTNLNDTVTEKLDVKTHQIDKTKLNNELSTDINNTFNSKSANKSENASVNNSEKNNTHLFWTFKNGRLVFETAPGTETEQSSRPNEVSQYHLNSSLESSLNGENSENCEQEFAYSGDDNEPGVLCSRDLNRRTVEGQSRLKHLENKLKKAGITDGKCNIFLDDNPLYAEDLKSKSSVDVDHKPQNIVSDNLKDKKVVEQVVDKLTQPLLKLDLNCEENVYRDLKSEAAEDLLPEANGSGDQVDFAGGSLCQFDVRQVDTFSGYNDSEFFLVYDELDNSSDEDECEYEHYHIIDEMRGDGSMGTDGERSKQHNPDRENLKSLLKKPGRGRDVKKNRVVFNENKNEFFDADYIILIREECDYDDEEDDGVCTCNDHEMVRLTCCEPNCNCNLYEGYSSDPTPQSPKFAPPLEFVDAVTLSPPEGYKDMELGEQQLLALQQMAMRGQRSAVCRDCSATHDDDGEGSQSDIEEHCEIHSDQDEMREETVKTDQSQQTTPTTPLPDHDTGNSQYLTMTTTITERQAARELEDDKRSISPNLPQIGSPISGILKGGRLWKQHSQEMNNVRNIELQQTTDSSLTSDEESNGNKRSVRFTESNENKRDVCDGAAEKSTEELLKEEEMNQQKDSIRNANSASPESTEMLLTLKLGNHILISNNSLKPNSAVRQLFPCSKPLSTKPGENDSVHQYLVTAESLRAFEEAKRSKLPQIIQSDETDESIKRAIERNTLRRSLIRYEPRPKKKEQKSDNSLVEQIKKLTCDVDDVVQDVDDIQQRASPPGEEARKSPEVNHLLNKTIDKSFSPSSSSTASSNSSSVSSTYRKITDLFAKREKQAEMQGPLAEPNPKVLNQHGPAPDLGNSGPLQQEHMLHHCPIAKSNSANDTRKQFLSTLAPLTACVSGVGTDDHYYHISHHIGDRASITSSVGTEYSLEDIDEGLKNEEDDTKRNAPDVVVGTPSASESGDELAIFVQQDAGRIERIKKKYQQDSEDDEHDDYGFNKRPSVRGIKPRFGTTTEILQQIQNQMQPVQTGTKTNAHVAWPYYSEASLSGLDNNKSHNINQNVPQYQYTYVTEEMKTKMYIQHYRPTSLVDDNVYQNCTNQRCNREVAYKTNANHVYSPVMRIGGGCSEIYHQAVPGKSRNGRPESPPPFDVARNVHQTMVYIPYNHIESYQPACVSPNPQYAGNEKCYARVVNQNQINRYAEPMYHNQPRMNQPSMIDVNVVKQIPKPVMRLPYPLPNSPAQPHMVNTRSESPLSAQFSTARSTQTVVPPMSSCNYYQTINPRYRPIVGPIISHSGVTWNGESVYSNKVNRHSFPAAIPRYPAPDNISLTDSESQYSGPLPNGYRQTIETTFSAQKDSLPNSPTKPRFIERGVPEGAASVSPQDTNVVAQSTSTMTSPTSPQNPPKPLYYAMNV